MNPLVSLWTREIASWRALEWRDIWCLHFALHARNPVGVCVFCGDAL